MKAVLLSSIFAIMILTGCHSGSGNDIARSANISDKPAKINTDSLEYIKPWLQFCDYLSLCDTAGAKSMIQFPLKTRGVLDSDPYISYTEKNWMGPINLYFKQQLGVVPCESGFAEKLKRC